MQDARSGPILLSNDFKLQHSVLLRIDKDFGSLLKSFLDLFENPPKITFEGTISNQHQDEWIELSGNKKTKVEEAGPSALSREVKKQFERRGATFNLLQPGCSWQDRSALYDVFCVAKRSGIKKLDRLFPLNSPVFLLTKDISNINQIFFLFDGTPSSIIGLKKMISLFSKKLSEASLTALLINRYSQLEEFDQKVLIDYLLANFIDVGVVLITYESLEVNLERLLKDKRNSLLVTGSEGAKIIFSKNVCNLLTNEVPIYFSTD